MSTFEIVCIIIVSGSLLALAVCVPMYIKACREDETSCYWREIYKAASKGKRWTVKSKTPR